MEEGPSMEEEVSYTSWEGGFGQIIVASNSYICYAMLLDPRKACVMRLRA